MKRKVVLILFIMFTFQLFFSCLCKCDEEIFENFYTEVILEPFYRAESATEGERLDIDETSIVSRDNFSFLISFNITSNQIATNNFINNFSNFGFAKANAAVDCFCDEDFVYPNKIKEVTIYSKEPNNNNRFDVTSNFDFQNYDNEFLSINEYVDAQIEDGLEIDLIDVVLVNDQNIFDETVFEIEVELESGEVLFKQTTTINFEE